MIKGLLDLQSAARGGALIFKKGLRLQGSDLAATLTAARITSLKATRPSTIYEEPPSVSTLHSSNLTPTHIRSTLDQEVTATPQISGASALSDLYASEGSLDRSKIDSNRPSFALPRSFGLDSHSPVLSSKVSAPTTSVAKPTESVEGTLQPPQNSVSSPLQTSETSVSLSSEPKLATTSTESVSQPIISENTTKPTASTVEEVLSSDVVLNINQLPEAVKEELVPVLKASRVPSSRIGRLFHYGSLATSLTWGAASEAVRRTTGTSSSTQQSVFLSEANIERLVDKLGRMRGAALKLGQFLSIQESGTLPEALEQVLRRVQAGADYMPDWQMRKVMSAELGADWEEKFQTFSPVPIASASIGQVHLGTVSAPYSPPSSPEDFKVAVKIQFPGVASSIASDLSNIGLLLKTSAILPKGLFLGSTMKVMKGELEDECDYVREAQCVKNFGELIEKDGEKSLFKVPRIVDALSSDRVLTMEFMEGKPISQVKGLSQEMRDKIGSSILSLCLRELFEFRLMQTDPNYSNFLWNEKTQQIELIDFGATREYSKEFMDNWFCLLRAAVSGDKAEMEKYSLRLKYLTGEEEPEMLSAHLESMSLVASPFRRTTSGTDLFDFTHQTIAEQVKAHIPTMLRHRLTPPPPETYSLNRKLSGAFLLCTKLKAKVPCAELWEEVERSYQI
ncbi:ABC (ATP binding cassette) 1 protein [Phaffia rhodozyma]|uniref:ABC (ATP binding cassette) 1 protein n=1 Tax=Phaffia rhodozyma TaxID=264483 RepID=A0A0F7SNF0_PHARH|nr:ABC (ATP binding cassette) 1 protein [Phaffia rhodozyma]